MCALSDEDVSIRREYYKKVKSQKYARFPKAIPAPDEDPSVSILVKSSNLERLKKIHWYHSDNKTITYDDLLTNLFDMINEATGRKDKF